MSLYTYFQNLGPIKCESKQKKKLTEEEFFCLFLTYYFEKF